MRNYRSVNTFTGGKIWGVILPKYFIATGDNIQKTNHTKDKLFTRGNQGKRR